MRLISWNVNGLRACLTKGFADYFAACGADVTREFYNGESGEGLGLKRFWGWSVLAYVMPFECETGYDPSKLDGNEIQPMGKELFQMEFPASDNPRPISTQLSQDGYQ